MRLLITSYDLTRRGGAQMFAVDLARKLMEYGHEPVMHSPAVGSPADDVRSVSVMVTTDMRTITQPPDVIIGNYHLGTMTALHQFPRCPAIAFVHASTYFTVARFPRIRRYVPVDETCRDFLVSEKGIEPESIEVILNSVDTKRFRERPPLPARPQRALLFGNEFVENQALREVRTVCDEAGIHLDVMGAGVRKVETAPERILPAYDLVFARARSALEAMATGAAVILMGPGGMGRLVTTADLDDYRRLNFGRRTLITPISADAIRREISRYDAADAAAVSARIRSIASLDVATSDILRLAEDVVEEQRRADIDVAAEYRATAAYLAGLESEYALRFDRIQTRLGDLPLVGGVARRLIRTGIRLLRI